MEDFPTPESPRKTTLDCNAEEDFDDLMSSLIRSESVRSFYQWWP